MHQPLVSYAQNREDLYLWGMIGHRPAGIYVDVGCYDETSHSVTKMLYERGWSGVNIDANPSFGPGYADRTRDRFIHSAVGSEAGTCSFRIYPEHDGLSTMDPEMMRAHEADSLPYQDVTAPVRTLDDILQQERVATVDVLKIDVEGAEASVLQGLDLTRTRPAVVVLEGVNPPGAVDILLAHSYRREFFDGLNVYYVDENAADVSIYNFAARVLHPGYYTAREMRLLAEVEALRAAAVLDPLAEHRPGVGQRLRALGSSVRTGASAVAERLRRVIP